MARPHRLQQHTRCVDVTDLVDWAANDSPADPPGLQWGVTSTRDRRGPASLIDRQVSAERFNAAMPPDRRPGIERRAVQQVRNQRRSLARDLLRLRSDAGATQGRVAAVAGIDRSHYSRIEAGTALPGLETLASIATALGADASIRLFAGAGPRLTDRHQARMVETLIRSLDPVWRPHVEVPVSRPARGVIDVVLEHRISGLLVATEVQSDLRRLEQQVRWSKEKAASLGSSALVHPGSEPVVSTLLVLRSTAATRGLAREFASILGVAYPARTADALAAIRSGGPWPGPSIVWIRIDGERVTMLQGPPSNVWLGRSPP
jgi:transcriptional regulator with XRE-family HTH domain